MRRSGRGVPLRVWLDACAFAASPGRLDRAACLYAEDPDFAIQTLNWWHASRQFWKKDLRSAYKLPDNCLVLEHYESQSHDRLSEWINQVLSEHYRGCRVLRLFVAQRPATGLFLTTKPVIQISVRLSGKPEVIEY
ncbi:MAG: hypothetical protein AAF829_13490 [Pseudomonadota bacterium]